MRRKCRKICKSQWMFWLIVILVFLNTCVLATEHHHQPPWLDDFQVGQFTNPKTPFTTTSEFQEYTNLFFVCLFTCEMLLKMYALGLAGYMVSLFNRSAHICRTFVLLRGAYIDNLPIRHYTAVTTEQRPLQWILCQSVLVLCQRDKRSLKRKPNTGQQFFYHNFPPVTTFSDGTFLSCKRCIVHPLYFPK